MRHIPLPTPFSGKEGVTIEVAAGQAGFSGFAPTIETEVQADFFVSNLGDDTNPGTFSEPWKTIGKVNTESAGFAPGTTVAFQRGDMFGDAILQPAVPGSAGNPIKFTAYGSGDKPIIGSTSLVRNLKVDVAYISVENLHFKFSSGTSGTPGHVDVTAANFSWLNCDLTGASSGNQGISGIAPWSGATDFVVDGGTITDINNSALSANGNASGTFRNLILNTVAQGGSNGDGFTSQSGSNVDITIEDTTFDLQNTGENCFDTKGSGKTKCNQCTFTNSPQAPILVQHSTDAEFNDCTIKASGVNSRQVHARSGGTGSGGTVTLRRTKIIDVDGTDALCRVALDYTLILEACALQIPAGSAATRCVETDNNGIAIIDNSSLVCRNGNTTARVVHVDTGGSCTVRNSILDTDGNGLVLESGVVDPFTLDQNLYESGSTGNWANINGTLYNEATIISTYDTSGSTTGDPNFSNEDDTNANFLLLNSGSPAIDLGDAAHAPATDLVGAAYGTPPNAGCRAGNA